MKVKIKDLSYREFRKICDSQHLFLFGGRDCTSCPLCDYKGRCKMGQRKYLDSEVEVDD